MDFGPFLLPYSLQVISNVGLKMIIYLIYFFIFFSFTKLDAMFYSIPQVYYMAGLLISKNKKGISERLFRF